MLRSMSKSVIMTEAYAKKIGYRYSPNVIYTLEQRVAPDSRIINTKSRQSIIDSFDVFMDILNTMVYMLTVPWVEEGT